MRFLASVLLALFCGACASPSSQEATKFGKAATDTLTVITDSRVANIDLVRESGIEERTCGYLSKGTIALDPPLNGKSDELLEKQLGLLTAVSDYAKALSDATDPQSISELEAAAAKLPGATSSLFAAIPNSAGSPLVGPAVTLISNVAINLVELETRARLRSVIQATKPYLDTAALQIIDDSDQVEHILSAAYKKWAAAKRCNLQLLRQNDQIVNGNAYLYSTYKDADNSARAFKQRLAILNKKKLIKTLRALIEAHDALLSGDVDFQLAFQRLQEIVKDLQGIRAAVAPAEPKKG